MKSIIRPAFITALAASAASTALSTACQTATEVTLDVSLVQDTCAQTNGTAITVASDPAVAEDRARGHYATAVTSKCDEATKRIGTLVLTPGDGDQGAVVVAVSFSKVQTGADCAPPAYTDCVVARRAFAFVDHTKLTLPIDIDFDCLNHAAGARHARQAPAREDPRRRRGSRAGAADAAADGDAADADHPADADRAGDGERRRDERRRRLRRRGGEGRRLTA